MVSTAIFPNITEKLENMTYFDILFSQFWGVIAAQGVICHPQLRKGVVKLQQVMSKHKQAFTTTAI